MTPATTASGPRPGSRRTAPYPQRDNPGSMPSTLTGELSGLGLRTAAGLVERPLGTGEPVGGLDEQGPRPRLVALRLPDDPPGLPHGREPRPAPMMQGTCRVQEHPCPTGNATSPVQGEAPSGLGHTGDPLFNRFWTLLGTPCITLPFNAGPFGLPLAVQLVGPLRSDDHLIAWARWAEQRLS